MMARALAGFREIGEHMDEAMALAYLGRLADSLGDEAQARDRLDEALRLSRNLGAREPELDALLFLALHCHGIGDGEMALVYAEQGWQIAQQLGGRSYRAKTLVILGHVRSSLNRLTEAEAAYQQALALYEALGNQPLAAEARAGLAAVALAQGDRAAALAQVELILNVLAEHPHAGLDEPINGYLTCYRVLEANGDPRAATVLQTAHDLLQKYAGHIADDALPSSFLENVPTHRELRRV